MILEDRVILAKTDEEERNLIIEQYTSFIKSAAAKSCGRFITESDEEFSAALLAFNEAIERFETEKGSFTAFAGLIIKSRVTDFLRKNRTGTIPFSAIASEDEEIEVIGALDAVSDAALEISELSAELSGYGISFIEISRQVPRTAKTRKAVAEIIGYILADIGCTQKVKKSGSLPVGELCEALGVHKKVPERHRKYIISAVVILSGDYSCVKPYIMGIFDGKEVNV